jgi:hypothetical protein
MKFGDNVNSEDLEETLLNPKVIGERQVKRKRLGRIELLIQDLYIALANP